VLDSQQEHKILLFSVTSRQDLGPTQPPTQLVPRAVFSGLKRPGHEDYQSPPPSAEIKNGGAISLLPIRLHGVVLT
jgi:hypothetical protein